MPLYASQLEQKRSGKIAHLVAQGAFHLEEYRHSEGIAHRTYRGASHSGEIVHFSTRSGGG